MRHLILTTLIITVALTGLNPVHGAEIADPGKVAKQEDIRKLIVASGSAMATIQSVDRVLARYRQQYPDMSETFWKDAKNTINPFDYLERLVPIYAKYLSHEEIKSLLSFYESAAGKKLVQAQPVLSYEAMQTSQQWGKQTAGKMELQIKSYAEK